LPSFQLSPTLSALLILACSWLLVRSPHSCLLSLPRLPSPSYILTSSSLPAPFRCICPSSCLLAVLAPPGLLSPHRLYLPTCLFSSTVSICSCVLVCSPLLACFCLLACFLLPSSSALAPLPCVVSPFLLLLSVLSPLASVHRPLSPRLLVSPTPCCLEFWNSCLCAYFSYFSCVFRLACKSA
jgi:hypothetical protein